MTSINAGTGEQSPADETRARPQPQKRLAPAVMVAVAVAAISILLGNQFPLIGAPIFAIILAAGLANIPAMAAALGGWRISEVSGKGLRLGIVLLGFTVNLAVVAEVGLGALGMLVFLVALALVIALGLGRLFRINLDLASLIGVGTAICGASAIAALSPVIRAKSADMAYAISVVFLFNMLAVIVYPLIGHGMGMSDEAFGTWAGAAINDTSAVIAAGFSYSEPAGTIATVVKLTRTTLIIPVMLLFGLMVSMMDRKGEQEVETGVMKRIAGAIPIFIILFVAASVINTAGLVGDMQPHFQFMAKSVMVVALAAVGLQCNWRTFAGAGIKPLLLGLVTALVVGIVSLTMIWSQGPV